MGNGIGLDVGTAFINAARFEGEQTVCASVRDAFLDLENDRFTRDMLVAAKAPFIESQDGKMLFVVGQEALNFANVFKRETRRPLSKGVVSTREPEALAMLKELISSVTGKAPAEGAPLRFSSPATPADADYNVTYHENVIKSFLSDGGWSAEPLNEGRAVAFAELASEGFTGLAVSFGAGMTNVSCLYKGVGAAEFSLARGGDWIDAEAAKAIGLRAAQITAAKEKGVDLAAPKGRTEEAITIFYKSFARYAAAQLERALKAGDPPEFPEPIAVVLAGGTSLAIGFPKLFAEELSNRDLPFKVKETRHAKDPFFAVAKGCLFAAQADS